MRYLHAAIVLGGLLLVNLGAVPAPAPAPARQCHYEADILLGDDAGYLRGAPIGHITVSACSSPADLAQQAAQLEANVRAQWAANRKAGP